MKIPPFRKFFSLPAHEQLILVNAFFLLIFIRLGLWLLPFRTLQRALEKLVQYSGRSTRQSLSPTKVSWAVSAASRYVPSVTCLALALTLQSLLSRQGIHSELELGVARDDKTGITAHAWLEIDGTVIIGGQERDRYTRLKEQE